MKETRYMALDFGDARVGVACTDLMRITAQPYCTIERKKGDKQLLAEIAEIIKKELVSKVVLGLPLGLDGVPTEQTKKVTDFAEKLKLFCNLEEEDLVLQDERLTSIQAERVLKDRKLKNAERRAAIDRMAAAIILQAYLES